MHCNLRIERRPTPTPQTPVLFADPEWQHAVVHTPTGYTFGLTAEQSDAEEIAERLRGIVPAHVLECTLPGEDLRRWMRVTNGSINRRVDAVFREYRNALEPVTATTNDLDGLLSPLIEKQSERPSEIELERLRECVKGFEPEDIRYAVRRHIEDFVGDGFFISRLFLERAAEVSRQSRRCEVSA